MAADGFIQNYMYIVHVQDGGHLTIVAADGFILNYMYVH